MTMGPIPRPSADLAERLIVSHQMDRYHRQLGPYNPRNFSHSEYTMYRGSGWLYGFYFVARGGQGRFNLNDLYNSSWTSTSGSYTKRFPFEFWLNFAGNELFWFPKPIHFDDGLRMSWDSGNLYLICYYIEDAPYRA